MPLGMIDVRKENGAELCFNLSEQWHPRRQIWQYIGDSCAGIHVLVITVLTPLDVIGDLN